MDRFKTQLKKRINELEEKSEETIQNVTQRQRVNLRGMEESLTHINLEMRKGTEKKGKGQYLKK